MNKFLQLETVFRKGIDTCLWCCEFFNIFDVI